MFTNTLSHEEVTKIKVVDGDEFNKSFKVSKSCLKLPFIEIQNFNYSNLVKWKMIKIKVVHIDEFYNFGIHEFFS